MEDTKRTKSQEFIIETAIIIEEKLGKGTDKVRKYERGKFLGKGGFAKCYELKCVETKKVYAAKIFEKKDLTNARSRKKLINEIKLHKKLHHQNIVNFEHFFEDKDNVYILLELCSNQTLNDILRRRKRLTEIEVQCYSLQILRALKYIHSHKIIHRDLKLGNCFITNKLELKLGDFGLAAKLEYEGQRRRTVCGTPNYIAPEILEKKNGHSFEVDVWSLGVVMYTLLFGRPPFDTQDVKMTYNRIKSNNYSFPQNMNVSNSAKKLITSILNPDPSKRPSLDTIANHEFFKIYTSVPIVMPLSTLACPPSGKYMAQYFRFDNSGNFYNNVNINGSSFPQFNNTFSSLHIRYNSPDTVTNRNRNNNNIDEINNKELHRRSESCSNFEMDKENVKDKVNQILMNNNNISTSSRNKMETNNNMFDKTLTSRLTKEEMLPGGQIINNNNYFINVTNVNNMEIRLEESVVKKLNSDEYGQNMTTHNVVLSVGNTNLTKNVNRITQFTDHTNKFGIVYSCGNNFVGVCFTDFTNIIKTLNVRSEFFNPKYQYIYLDKDGRRVYNFDENGYQEFLKNKSIPKDLAKKFEIFHLFTSKFSNPDSSESYQLFYVKKFMKVQHAMMFRLSNKNIQVSFVDKTEIIMSTETNDIIFKDKNGKDTLDTIQNFMNSNKTEVVKRIKYAKNLLIHFVKDQKTKKTSKE